MIRFIYLAVLCTISFSPAAADSTKNGDLASELWTICIASMNDLRSGQDAAMNLGWQDLSPDAEAGIQFGYVDIQKEFAIKAPKEMPDLNRTFAWIHIQNTVYPDTTMVTCKLNSGAEAYTKQGIDTFRKLAAGEGFGLSQWQSNNPPAASASFWSKRTDAKIVLVSVIFDERLIEAKMQGIWLQEQEK